METWKSPIQIGNRFAPNRIVNQPMECNDADDLGRPTALTLDRYRRLAEGRAGIIIIEALTISQESRARYEYLTNGSKSGSLPRVKSQRACGCVRVLITPRKG